MSRSYADLLVLVDVDIDVLKPSSSTTAAATTSTTDRAAGGAGSGAPLDSAFASSHGNVMSLAPSSSSSSSSLGGNKSTAAAAAATVVAGVLERGLDIIVAVHDGFGRTREHDKVEAKKQGPARGRTSIVEVVKDRGGGGFGGWCLWVQ